MNGLVLFLVGYVAVGVGIFVQLTAQDPCWPTHFDEWAIAIFVFVLLVALWPWLVAKGVTRAEHG